MATDRPPDSYWPQLHEAVWDDDGVTCDAEIEVAPVAELESERTARREEIAAHERTKEAARAEAATGEMQYQRAERAEAARREAEANADNFRRGHDEILRANGTLAQQIDALIAAVEEHDREKQNTHIWRGAEGYAKWHLELDRKLYESVRSIAQGNSE